MTPSIKSALLELAEMIRDVATAPSASTLDRVRARAIGMMAGLGDTRDPAFVDSLPGPRPEPTKSIGKMAREFNTAMGAPSRITPDVQAGKERHLPRLEWGAEELGELARALGYDCTVTFTPNGAAPDIVAAADAIADIIYVTATAADEWGLPTDALLAEVHRSNMSKERTTEGKVRKGPGYSPPRIAEVLGLYDEPFAPDNYGLVDDVPIDDVEDSTEPSWDAEIGSWIITCECGQRASLPPGPPPFGRRQCRKCARPVADMEAPASAECGPTHAIGDRVEIKTPDGLRIGTVRMLDAVGVDIGGAVVACAPGEVVRV